MVCSPYSSGALICQRHVVGVPFLPGFASSRSGEFTNTLFEALSVLSGMAWRSAAFSVWRFLASRLLISGLFFEFSD
jgi:hypothetical protein